MRKHDMHVKKTFTVELSIANLADMRSNVGVRFTHVPIEGDLRAERLLALCAHVVAALFVHCAHVPL